MLRNKRKCYFVVLMRLSLASFSQREDIFETGTKKWGVIVCLVIMYFIELNCSHSKGYFRVSCYFLCVIFWGVYFFWCSLLSTGYDMGQMLRSSSWNTWIRERRFLGISDEGTMICVEASIRPVSFSIAWKSPTWELPFFPDSFFERRFIGLKTKGVRTGGLSQDPTEKN